MVPDGDGPPQCRHPYPQCCVMKVTIIQLVWAAAFDISQDAGRTVQKCIPKSPFSLEFIMIIMVQILHRAGPSSENNLSHVSCLDMFTIFTMATPYSSATTRLGTKVRPRASHVHDYVLKETTRKSEMSCIHFQRAPVQST